MLRELTSLSLNINNDTLVLSSASEADPVTGGPAYKLSPSLPLGSHIQTMGELVITHLHLGVEPTRTSTVEAADTFVMVWPPSPSPPTPSCLQPHPPPLCSICPHSTPTPKHTCTTYASYITPTLGLTMDQYWTHSDLVPMPRAAIYIPFLHLSYLPDPFSLTIMGNYSFLV